MRIVLCPECGARYQIDDEHVGMQFQCDACKRVYVATPEEDAVVPVPPIPSSPPPPPPAYPPPLPGYVQPGGFAHPVVVRRGLANWTVALLIIAFLGECLIELGPFRADLDRNAENLPAALILLGASLSMLLGLLAALVTKLCWVYYSYRNLYGLGADSLGAETMRFTPAGAVWWHFCPVVNLWKIPQILSDLWIGSDPHHRRQSSPVIPLWICLVIVCNILSRLSTNEDMENKIPPGLSVLLSAAETVCHCYIVLKITHFQSQKQQQSFA